MIVFIVFIGIAAVLLTQRPVGAQTTELVFWSVPGAAPDAHANMSDCSLPSSGRNHVLTAQYICEI